LTSPGRKLERSPQERDGDAALPLLIYLLRHCAHEVWVVGRLAHHLLQAHGRSLAATKGEARIPKGIHELRAASTEGGHAVHQRVEAGFRIARLARQQGCP